MATTGNDHHDGLRSGRDFVTFVPVVAFVAETSRFVAYIGATGSSAPKSSRSCRLTSTWPLAYDVVKSL